MPVHRPRPGTCFVPCAANTAPRPLPPTGGACRAATRCSHSWRWYCRRYWTCSPPTTSMWAAMRCASMALVPVPWLQHIAYQSSCSCNGCALCCMCQTCSPSWFSLLTLCPCCSSGAQAAVERVPPLPGAHEVRAAACLMLLSPSTCQLPCHPARAMESPALQPYPAVLHCAAGRRGWRMRRSCRPGSWHVSTPSCAAKAAS